MTTEHVRGTNAELQDEPPHHRMEPGMAANAWEIDVGHSAIRFWVRHMMITKVRGTFTRWSGTITLDEQDVTRSSVAVRIEAASIEPRWAVLDAEVAIRDERLRSAEFLDVARYPEITFRSKRIENRGTGYRLVGDLSLHGVQREVALEAEFGGIVKDRSGNERASLTARTAFHRATTGCSGTGCWRLAASWSARRSGSRPRWKRSGTSPRPRRPCRSRGRRVSPASRPGRRTSRHEAVMLAAAAATALACVAAGWGP